MWAPAGAVWVVVGEVSLMCVDEEGRNPSFEQLPPEIEPWQQARNDDHDLLVLV